MLFNKITQWSKAKGAKTIDDRIPTRNITNGVKLLILGTKISQKSAKTAIFRLKKS
jgi:hypothetical protein